MNKICKKCCVEKPTSEFEKRKDSKDGYRPVCKLCRYGQKQKSILVSDKYWNSRAHSLINTSRPGKARIIIKSSTKVKGDDLKRLYESVKCCQYCGVELPKEKAVIEHKIPLSRGGAHNMDNITISCADCNNLKGTRTDLEFFFFINNYINRFCQSQ